MRKALAILFCVVCILPVIVYLYFIGSITEGIDGGQGEGEDECTVLERIHTEDGRIEIVDDACKEGLPHTTDSNTIRMTRQSYESNGRTNLLVHERVHLDQKRNPTQWAKFYKTHWDYDITHISPIPAQHARHLRPNPDTASNPWAIWRQRYVFFPYAEPESTLKDARVRVWDTLENKFVPVPEQWKTRFCDADGCPHQYEHPHEISAELITKQQKSVAAAQLTHWLHEKI